MPEILRGDASRIDDLYDLWLQLREAQAATTGHWGPLRSVEEGWRRRRQNYVDILDEGGTLFLAMHDGELAGYAIGEREEGGSPTWAWPKDFFAVVDVVVRADLRRSGIASALFDAVEAEARERGVDALDLMVAGPNADARAFYERLGFRPDLVTYRKPLD